MSDCVSDGRNFQQTKETGMANGHRMACMACGLALLGAGMVRAETPDAWLEYVEAQGRSAVDVGVVGRAGTKVETKFRWTAERNGEMCLLGARKTGDDASRAEFICSSGGNGYAVFGFGSELVQLRPNPWSSYQWDRDRDFTATVELFTTNETQTAMTFGLTHSEWGSFLYYPAYNSNYTNAPNPVVTNGLSDTGLDLYLFAGNVDGAVENRAWARVYSLKVWQDGELVRDLKPCLKDGRAGLYDAVSDAILYALDGTDDLAFDAAYNEPDYFIDYADSTGSAYVDVEVPGRSGTSCRADMAWLNLNGDFAFLNARSALDVNDRVFLLHTSWDGKMSIGYGGFIRASDNFLFTAGTRYLVETTLEAGRQTVDVDGQRIYSATSSASYDTGRSFYLFANHVGEQALNKSQARLYSLKIWQDGALVRDFLPCVKYGRVALYDAVDRRIFYPQGGELVTAPITAAGKPDRYLEYVESPGGTYLDTGVRARTGTAAAAKMRWNALGLRANFFSHVDSLNESTFLGACAADANNRMYLIHSPNAQLWFGYGMTKIYPVLPETTTRIELSVDRDYAYESSYMADAQTLALDGAQYVSEQIADPVDAGCNLYLFGANIGNRCLRYAGRSRVYELKIWQDGELVRDFRPCMKNGRAGLYDAVGDKVYYTVLPLPDSCIGPAKDADALRPTHLVEFLETDGRHWLDTGITGRSGTVAEFDMAWLDVGGDVGFFGSSRAREEGEGNSADGPLRFYPWHNARKVFSYGCKSFLYVNRDDPSVAAGWQGAANGILIDPARPYHVRTDFAADRIQIVVDGKAVIDRAGDFDVDTRLPMYLFGENVMGEAGNIARARIYGMKIWQDGVLVRNFVPVRLGGESGTPALWDKVGAKPFFLNDKASFARVGPVVGENPAGFLILFR